MKILVTGNMGYIGPCLEKHFMRHLSDAFLIGYDTGYFAHCLTAAEVFPETRVKAQYFGDIRDFPASLLDGVDAVVHLAGLSNDPMGNSFEEVTYDINLESSVELAKKAKAAGVKNFVFASSCSVYGSAADVARKEDSPLAPLTAYAKSKIGTEKGICDIADQEFVVTCLRFATACGMSERLRLDLVLNDFVAGALSSNKITILSDGTPWRPLINIKDMARAIEWAVTRPEENGGSFLAINVGSDEWNYQVIDLAKAVAELIPSTEISINKDAAPDKRSYRVNFALFRQLAPHHQPKMDLRSTILELKSGLVAMNFTDPNFRNSSFMRLKVLTELRQRNLLSSELRWLR
jgi:nucleoside-diphosphate-sugar epimerase